MRSEGIVPHILKPGTWGRVVSFTPRPLYSQGTSHLHPINRMLIGSLF